MDCQKRKREKNWYWHYPWLLGPNRPYHRLRSRSLWSSRHLWTLSNLLIQKQKRKMVFVCHHFTFFFLRFDESHLITNVINFRFSPLFLSHNQIHSIKRWNFPYLLLVRHSIDRTLVSDWACTETFVGFGRLDVLHSSDWRTPTMDTTRAAVISESASVVDLLQTSIT